MFSEKNSSLIRAAELLLVRRASAAALRTMLVAVCACLIGPSFSPAAPKPASHSPAHAPAARNPHLHGFHDERHDHLDHHRRHWWLHRWVYGGDFTTWYAENNGLGIIEGTISGPGSSGAKVWLRKSNGHAFARTSMKHTTHADSLGHYLMLGVRPGNYRIMVEASTATTHSPAHVDAGLTLRADVRLPY